MWKENFKYTIIILYIGMIPQLLNGQQLSEDYFLKGLAGFQQQMYDSALVSFALSKGMDEKNPLVWYYSGRAYLEKGQLSEAISDFQKAEELQPGISSLTLAKIYARQNNVNKALEYLEIHLNSNFKKPESVLLLDEDLSRLENRKEWIEFWKQSSHYSRFDKLVAEVEYLCTSEDYIEAINLIGEGLKKNYREAPLLAKRAKVYIKMGDDGAALRDLNRAIDQDRRNDELLALRGEVNYRLGNYEQAAEDYENSLKYNYTSLSLYTEMARALSKAGQYEQAKLKMEDYLTLFPKDDKAWYTLGKIHNEAGRYLDALRSLNHAIEMNHKQAGYYLARGESYYNSRTYTYASNDLSMALDLDPENPDAYYLKGLTALKQGDTELACYCFKYAYRFGKKEAFNKIGENCRQ